MNNHTTQLRWFVDRDTGSWVLQFRVGDSEWAKVPVVFMQEVES